jgi:hypothetical protein
VAGTEPGLARSGPRLIRGYLARIAVTARVLRPALAR